MVYPQTLEAIRPDVLVEQDLAIRIPGENVLLAVAVDVIITGLERLGTRRSRPLAWTKTVGRTWRSAWTYHRSHIVVDVEVPLIRRPRYRVGRRVSIDEDGRRPLTLRLSDAWGH
jgi:hypothetical protein